MTIFKTVALSASVICASLFLGDVNASELNIDIKSYVNRLFSPNIAIDNSYTAINKAVENIKQITIQRFDEAQIDKNIDSIIKLDNSSLYILSRYRLNSNDYLIQKLSKLQEETDTANKINILTKKMIVSFCDSKLHGSRGVIPLPLMLR